jgi:xylan 1,4-beta-xylosidase
LGCDAAQRSPIVIHNPILRGFFPDPSICRVGDDYYLVNSTFEWFPGVSVHRSRDLVHWQLIGHLLNSSSLLDLRGVGDSCGVWAPSLSHADGLFWLVYTNVHTRTGVFKDTPVFLTTASDILGPWSAPISLGSCGFDPSLFHDDDGRKWIINIQWDPRPGHSRFGGIVHQEYDPFQKKLVGALRPLLQKPELTEGPNLYKRDGWYYLMMAEGGTGWNHGISMARAHALEGPYELDPQHSVLTTRDDATWPLQKAGHGELVQTQKGEWYLAHLCSRPLKTDSDAGSASSTPLTTNYAGLRCMLGRETALQRVVWSDDGWLRLESGGVLPRLEVAAPSGLSAHPWPQEPARDDFDAPLLSPHWQSLRVPVETSWASLTERPGWVRLRGRESLHSLFGQSLIARRLTALRVTAETCLEFTPAHFTQRAGLICWYDTKTHYYLRVTQDAARGHVLGVVFTDDTVYEELSDNQLEVDSWPRFYLRAGINYAELQFFASPDGQDWQAVGPILDASKLSDDYGQGLHFTGTFVGLCVQDLNGMGTFADFDYFSFTDVTTDVTVD